jgi:hypothetical protein
MVYLPPDLETKTLSLECGISTRATMNTFLEMPLLIKIRSPSRIIVRLSRFRLMSPGYHRRFHQANLLNSPAQFTGACCDEMEINVHVHFHRRSA